MSRIAVRLLSGGEQPVDVEVSAGARAAQREGLIAALRVQRSGVVLGVDSDGGDTELMRSTGDADRDLAAVSDQKFLESHVVILKTVRFCGVASCASHAASAKAATWLRKSGWGSVAHC